MAKKIKVKTSCFMKCSIMSCMLYGKNKNNNKLLYEMLHYVLHALWKKKIKIKTSYFMKCSIVELRTPQEATSCAAIRKFQASYGTRRFITEFTRALHLFLS
jgi:hypothetical protein